MDSAEVCLIAQLLLWEKQKLKLRLLDNESCVTSRFPNRRYSLESNTVCITKAANLWWFPCKNFQAQFTQIILILVPINCIKLYLGCYSTIDKVIDTAGVLLG